MKSLFLTLLSFVALHAQANKPAALPATTEYVISSDSRAEFEAVGKPSLLKIKGHGATVSGAIFIDSKGATGKFEIELDQLDTGIDMRNRHMKEKYLETAKFPKAILEVTEIQLPKDWAPGVDVPDAAFKGNLTLKEKSKPINGTVKISGSNMTAEAKFSLSLSDFDVGVPSYLGITVANLVNVSVTVPKVTRK